MATPSSASAAGIAPRARWTSLFSRGAVANDGANDDTVDHGRHPPRWSMGVLNDAQTHEVPGSVLLLTNNRNEPLGLRNQPSRTSHSSLPSAVLSAPPSRAGTEKSKKKTPNGAIILEPQPDDSHNDPLNWPAWRRDAALLCLGFYCMLGGGMTPILAAGFTNVANDFSVTTAEVALTTGIYMAGLGVGAVIFSPTAILYGKRPVYLGSCLLFIVTAVWCAVTPDYHGLVAARILQGIAVSPVECLPSATIAEIFFLHERAFRIGIYGLLLLGGKNLIPLVSAAIIESLSWRWVFWIVAMVAGFSWILLLLFVPETFWDRTPRPKSRRTSSFSRRMSEMTTFRRNSHTAGPGDTGDATHDSDLLRIASSNSATARVRPSTGRQRSALHVEFTPEAEATADEPGDEINSYGRAFPLANISPSTQSHPRSGRPTYINAHHSEEERVRPAGGAPPTPGLHNFNSPFYSGIEQSDSDYMKRGRPVTPAEPNNTERGRSFTQVDGALSRAVSSKSRHEGLSPSPMRYTKQLKDLPARTFVQQLRPWEGRLHQDRWLKVACRPFILFAYPAVLWSSAVYACSVGWLIVLSESVAEVYRNKETYNFSALSVGLIYISPFIGGILGTAVAGKVSDIIVQAMSRRNGGLYEPEFRLVMAIPVAITTVIGLMGFGWSAQEHDAWIVPTVFFGIISFGCSLGATTAITFCVDSYRQYAGEALVTLNFSKNVFHGLVFSLFFNNWLEADGSKTVFLALGGIQLGILLFTIPMYIFGKRARMWTVRKNFMEKF